MCPRIGGRQRPAHGVQQQCPDPRVGVGRTFLPRDSGPTRASVRQRRRTGAAIGANPPRRAGHTVSTPRGLTLSLTRTGPCAGSPERWMNPTEPRAGCKGCFTDSRDSGVLARLSAVSRRPCLPAGPIAGGHSGMSTSPLGWRRSPRGPRSRSAIPLYRLWGCRPFRSRSCWLISPVIGS